MPVHAPSHLPRHVRWPTSTLLTLAVVMAWASLLDGTPSPFEPSAQTMDLVLGVLALTAGVHARNFAYLHAPSNLWWVASPIPRDVLWTRAQRRQRAILGRQYLIGLAVLVVVSWSRVSAARLQLACLDWTTLCAAALTVEPWVASASARWGRRFPASHPITAAQRQLSGGWTPPHSVVHLYAGGLAIALAGLLGMIGQFAIFPNISTAALPSMQALAAAAAPALLAAPVAWWGRRWYCRPSWAAIPWLHESIQTLAGPPTPTPAPAWVRVIPSPVLRVHVTRVARTTPLFTARLLAPTIWAAAVLSQTVSPGAVTQTLGMILAVGWLKPALELVSTVTNPDPVLAALPSTWATPGRLQRWSLWVMVATPAVVPLALVFIASSILGQ